MCSRVKCVETGECKMVETDVILNELKERYSEVWDTEQMQKTFEVLGFSMGYCVVVRREDGQKGSLDFCHSPRYYYNFMPHFS